MHTHARAHTHTHTHACPHIPYGTKILHGIEFYGFMVSGRTVKLKSVNWMKIYYILP